MDSLPLTGTAADPTPYLALAYGLAAMLLFGFALWSLRQRWHLRRLLATLEQGNA